jgi:hypothetical protein
LSYKNSDTTTVSWRDNVVACLAVTVSWRLVGNHGRRANNQGNVLTFPS